VETGIELSVIIPTLDEKAALPALFGNLASQEKINFEAIICDGGSIDGTPEAAKTLATNFGIAASLVTGFRGRGAQLNAGSVASKGRYLLFLHADSRFDSSLAVRKGIDELAGCDIKEVAGKFTLHFERSSSSPSLAYNFYESKARLIRPECTHGDQGLLMHRDIFAKFGPFDEFPQMMSETRLAERIRKNGQLRLIPEKIITSARRFESEGLYQRQVINAILMNCASQGWNEPFTEISDIYRNQHKSGRLQLSPILEKIAELISLLPSAQRSKFWKSTGSYVRGNAWQIAFFIDVRRHINNKDASKTALLKNFDRFVAPLLECVVFDRIASIITWLWFKIVRYHSKIAGI